MPQEFNPFDPKYKSVEDLPAKQQGSFANLPEGGFVRKEATQRYEAAKAMANGINKSRNFGKKLLGKDKVTGVNLLQDQALGPEAEADRETAESLLALKKGFENIFKDKEVGKIFTEYINQHKFDSVISEDTKGRLVAEALKRALNKIYKNTGQSEVILVSFPMGRNTKDEDLKNMAEKVVQSGKLGKGTIYVTEWVFSGATVIDALKSLDLAVHNLEAELSQIPKHYALLTLGSKYDLQKEVVNDKHTSSTGEVERLLKEFAPNAQTKEVELWELLVERDRRDGDERLKADLAELERIKNLKVKLDFVANGKVNTDSYHFHWGKYAGVRRQEGQTEAASKKLTESEAKARDEVIEKAANYIVKLYQENLDS